MNYVPSWIYERAWSGRARECPKCATVFHSAFDRGQCNHCRHHFVASDVYGLPDGVGLAEVISLSLNECQASLKSLDELHSVTGFPIPAKHPTAALDEQADWDWHRNWLLQSLEAGGILFVRRNEGAKHWVETYFVVNAGRLVAWMTTGQALWD